LKSQTEQLRCITPFWIEANAAPTVPFVHIGDLTAVAATHGPAGRQFDAVAAWKSLFPGVYYAARGLLRSQGPLFKSSENSLSETHKITHPVPKSDLHNGKAEAKKPYRQILKEEVSSGMRELRRPALSLFLSALSAGLDVGFSLLLMATMMTFAGHSLSWPVTELLIANCYAVGILFVVLGRSELFT
jgi:hypothetical protein